MKPVLPGEVYKHKKGGRYLVLHISEESTNARVGTAGVVYLSLAKRKVHHRDLTEFVEKVKWPDGKMRTRFILDDE